MDNFQVLPAFFILSSLILHAFGAALSNRCSHDTFAAIDIPEATVVNVAATPVHDFSTSTVQNGDIPTANFTGLDFCNVTITYSHGSDETNVQIWLPNSKEWNGRFQATGGGGYIAGYGPEALTPAVAKGYVAACTDGGHASNITDSWALISEGQVNQVLLEDFASISLNELASIGKSAIQIFYLEAPTYSYFTGCSTGGRQGMMLAQRYPEAFDGILALAPAINWPAFQVADYWGQHVMDKLGYYPEPCELLSLTQEAISACDALDGVNDGVISRPEICKFDATSIVGTNITCNGTKTVRPEAAEIANAIWSGPITLTGQRLWYGLNKDAPLTGLPRITPAETKCLSNGNCVGVPFSVSEEWIRLFVEKNSSFDVTTLSDQQYAGVFQRSAQEYDAIIGTANPDLSAFRNAGGKILTWHGLADQLVAVGGTIQYYDQVTALDPGGVDDYYRLYLAPGTTHCGAGTGPYPNDSLEVLVEWVEQGVAPDTLTASAVNNEGQKVERELCLYPKEQTFVGGDPDVSSSFKCV